jgi:hypothetical protein
MHTDIMSFEVLKAAQKAIDASELFSLRVGCSKTVSFETHRKPAPMLALACFISLFHIGQTVSNGSPKRSPRGRFSRPAIRDANSSG